MQMVVDFILQRATAENGVPTGIRTPVTAVKGRCPRPLDDRDVEDGGILRSRHQTVKEVRRQFVQNIAKQFSRLLRVV